MSRPIAVVDTSVLILLLDTTSDPVTAERKAHCELTVERLEKLARFVVPAPVVAELCRAGSGSDLIRNVFRRLIARLRIEVLDEDAADVAGEISRTRLQNRTGRERGAVKFDALIAGVAQRLGARWLVTADPDHMRRCFAVINSPVEVVVADQPPTVGQLSFLRVLRPGE